MKAILTEIEVGYPKLTESQMLIFRKYLPEARFKVVEEFCMSDYQQEYKDDPEKQKKIAKEKYDAYLLQDEKELAGYSHKFICDINIFLGEFPLLKFTVLGTREFNVDIDKNESLKIQEKAIEVMMKSQRERLNSMFESFVKMSENIAENLKVETLNQKCDVHVGGGMLMTVNETMLLEDSCTDALQGELNSGWRILAVNVQNDCRRPDYVLGRFNPNLQLDGDAKRG